MVLAAMLIGFAASTLAYRYRIIRVPGESVVARMDRELRLTPAQRSQIRDIMHDSRLRIMEHEREFRRQRHQAFVDAMDQIRGILTPEQQKTFDREFLSSEARARLHESRGASPIQPPSSSTESASPSSGPSASPTGADLP